MKESVKSVFGERIVEYRIATIYDCETLTDLRMRMRKELDSDFNSWTAMKIGETVSSFRDLHS